MALLKRGKTWHCHFVVNGQRFRQSLGTKDWREAQSKEKELIGQAMEGKVSQSSISLARQPFGQAADDYVTARKLELAPASQAKERQLLVQLRAYFKQEPLKSITAKRISEYRTWRAEQKITRAGGEHSVGPATLNAELGISRRIMKRARVWSRVADDIRPLREPSTIGRALTEGEKQRLLKTAVMRPEWETAYLAAVLCLNTTARGCELKGLQWSDVDLFARTLTIRKSKTAAGERVVPLTDVAASAIARLRRRAEGFGTVEPSHYVFAAFAPKFTFSGKRVIDYNVTAFDPNRHLNSWRSAWRTLTKKGRLARFPVPRSSALRDHAACGKRNFRLNDHGDCRTREPANAGALQSRAYGSEAESDGSPCCEHQNGRL
ncbi:MAG TPA: tyrosine-type recombinase/integrase [Candidatus Sulfotelmatobacter sp.]|nr:tyrosine-type recombinase/integrase [Candidatus Sulfotelmatobacter sp.]